MDYKIGDKIKVCPIESRQNFQNSELLEYLEDYGKNTIFEVYELCPRDNQIKIIHNHNKFNINPKNWDIITTVYNLPEDLFTI